MAKAKEIIGLDCAAPVLERAAEVLRVRFDEVVNLRDAALDFSDIEGVHSMRVATRRLRSALRDYTPFMSQRLPKQLRKELKQLADALGAVRDEDVAIVALETLQLEADKTESVKAGIGKLLKERSDAREVARLNLTEALAVQHLDDLQNRFAAAIDKMATRKKSKRAISFNEAGREVVADGLQDLLDLGTSLYEPFKTEELHEMRIAAKRLRYAIELFVACWGEKIAPFAAEIADMQSFWAKFTIATSGSKVWASVCGAIKKTQAGTKAIIKPPPGFCPNSSRNEPKNTVRRSNYGANGKQTVLPKECGQ